MKGLGKIFIACLVLIVSVSNVFSLNEFEKETVDSYKKVKPKPVYEFDEVNKKFKFIDAICNYRVNNMHWDIIKEGSVKEKNVDLDLSTLKSGKYIIEIEHEGYLFTEDIIL